MRVSYVNLYMIDTETPDPDDLTGESPGDTVEILRYGWSAVEVIEDLWRLVDPDQAARFASFYERFQAQNLRLSRADVDELAALLAPLPAAVVGPLVSRDTWALRAEQVASLRAEAPSIFDHERPITDEVHAVAEALHAAESLREFLVRASRGGYEVHAN
jgi:hypothetical protein